MFDPKMFVHIPKCAGMTIRRSDVLRGKIIPAVPQTHKSPEYTKALEEQMAEAGRPSRLRACSLARPQLAVPSI